MSQCPTLTRSRSLGILKGWSQSWSRNFLKPWSRNPTKNEDSTFLAGEQCKNGRTNRYAVWSFGLGWAQGIIY